MFRITDLDVRLKALGVHVVNLQTPVPQTDPQLAQSSLKGVQGGDVEERLDRLPLRLVQAGVDAVLEGLHRELADLRDILCLQGHQFLEGRR